VDITASFILEEIRKMMIGKSNCSFSRYHLFNRAVNAVRQAAQMFQIRTAACLSRIKDAPIKNIVTKRLSLSNLYTKSHDAAEQDQDSDESPLLHSFFKREPGNDATFTGQESPSLLGRISGEKPGDQESVEDGEDRSLLHGFYRKDEEPEAEEGDNPTSWNRFFNGEE